jgi:hypothetical protein
LAISDCGGTSTPAQLDGLVALDGLGALDGLKSRSAIRRSEPSPVNRPITLRRHDRITPGIGRLTPDYQANFWRLTGQSLISRWKLAG